MVGHVGFRAAVAHDPPVQDAPIPRDGPAQQGLVVFAGLEITGQPTSDPQQMLQLLQGMVQFWTQRTAELARHNPAMLEMLALLEGCTVRATDRGVLLTMERTVLAIDQPQENPYNPALTHKSDAWMPVDAHPTDR
ncbi:MAG: hypothetical protein KatS3mg103_0276 [Phycisphaerales bacterium]|nr:MAG: hypothetical protein KatS3mg103_0276 [Phycisphaerales bacterium]